MPVAVYCGEKAVSSAKPWRRAAQPRRRGRSRPGGDGPICARKPNRRTRATSMSNPMQFSGIHHLTAISADAKGNVDFYTRQLGMRLVKKTVNQDDVSAYHLFYADKAGSPGTDLTFFDWPAAPERRGTNSIARTALRVAGEDTLNWWEKRLADAGVPSSGIN